MGVQIHPGVRALHDIRLRVSLGKFIPANTIELNQILHHPLLHNTDCFIVVDATEALRGQFYLFLIHLKCDLKSYKQKKSFTEIIFRIYFHRISETGGKNMFCKKIIILNGLLFTHYLLTCEINVLF